MSRKMDLIMLICLIACAAWLAGGHFGKPEPWSPASLPRERFQLSLAPLVELNGKTTEQLAEMRRQAVGREARLRALVPSGYSPSTRPVWAQVASGESWNGVFGTLYGTAANQAQTFSDGPSWESFVLVNPFVLGSLYAHFGCFGQSRDENLGTDYLSGELPSAALWDGAHATLTVTYVHHGTMPEFHVREGVWYNLNLINARDLGLEAFAILSKDSQGVDMGFDTIYPNNQAYLSDAVPGSPHKLNNLLYGPAESEVVKVKAGLPVRVHLAFWRHREGAALDQPDFNEVIEIASITD